MAIDYSQLAGMNYDKTSPELSEGAVWASKQVYGAIQNINYGIMWILDKNTGLLDNTAEVNAYSKRFTHQWKTSAKIISNKGINSNPIRKIVTYVVTEYSKRKPIKTIGKVMKGLSAKSLKMLTTSLTISKVVSIILRDILTIIMANQFIRKFLTFFGTFGIAMYISYQGLQMKSFDSIRGLRIMKPKVYGYLYNQNIETFWFLVQPYLTNVIRYI